MNNYYYEPLTDLSNNKIIFNRYVIYNNKILVYDLYNHQNLMPYKNYKYFIKDDSGQSKVYTFRYLYKIAYNKLFIIDNIKDLDGEEWREISGTSGKYFISNMGRTKSYCSYNAKILQPIDNGKNYNRVSINGKKVLIHKLVMQAFNYNMIPPKGYDIDHINNNSKDNRLVNLQYLTSKANRQKAVEHRKIMKEEV